MEGKTWKTGVWAEPELIDAAYYEFSEDTGRYAVYALSCRPSDCHYLCRFLATEETIVPPYRFGVFDLLVLPPSFPYGGMVIPVYVIS